MSDLPSNIERQKRNGYLMLASTVVIAVGTVGVFWYYDFPPISYLGVLVPVGILGFFGYRAVSAGRERRALGDERTAELYGKVGLNSFWMLLSVIVVDMGFSIFPRDGASTIYVFFGLLCYGSYYGYYRYVE